LSSGFTWMGHLPPISRLGRKEPRRSTSQSRESASWKDIRFSVTGYPSCGRQFTRRAEKKRTSTSFTTLVGLNGATRNLAGLKGVRDVAHCRWQVGSVRKPTDRPEEVWTGSGRQRRNTPLQKSEDPCAPPLSSGFSPLASEQLYVLGPRPSIASKKKP